MKSSIETKLTCLSERYEQLGHYIIDPEVIKDQERFREYAKERAKIEPIVFHFRELQKTLHNIEQTKALLNSQEAKEEVEMCALVEEELNELNQKKEGLEKSLMIDLLPEDPNDELNVFLEIRAGTGGNEAAIFVNELLTMYLRYAEIKRWKVEILSSNKSEQGGYKEVIVRVEGKKVYSQLKFESGVHRVQRVPITESQGRIHTSACTVAVLPELEKIDSIVIDPSDLRVDTYRASGAGGQHVNKTDSAVRITHLPTGVIVECQDDRSQHKNRARAMSLLQAKILTQEQKKQHHEQAQTRRSLVGSGDRSERIRTYNFPQGRVTDHRIGLTLYKLNEILQGSGLEYVIKPLIQEHQAQQLLEE